MLFRDPFLEGVQAGRFSVAFRRWTQPRVKVGTKMRTGVGVVEIVSLEPVMEFEITSTDAERAGYASKADLLAELSQYTEGGQLYRVTLRYGGEDPRIQLRNDDELSDEEFDTIKKKLKGYEREGAWTNKTLKLIAKHEATLASNLAEKMGMEKYAFKRRVRQLKELGLTESLDVGYRLSPRGKAFLKRLK
jgi:hypothetical protein